MKRRQFYTVEAVMGIAWGLAGLMDAEFAYQAWQIKFMTLAVLLASLAVLVISWKEWQARREANQLSALLWARALNRQRRQS